MGSGISFKVKVNSFWFAGEKEGGFRSPPSFSLHPQPPPSNDRCAGLGEMLLNFKLLGYFFVDSGRVF